MMISLPSKWIKKFNLKKGDEVDVSEYKDSIVIKKQGIEGKKQTEIKAEKETESILRTLLVNAYRSGYDKVLIRYKGEKQFEELKKTIKNYVLGYDITKKEKDFCIVESITDPSPDQFDAITNKIFFNIKELITVTKQRLEKYNLKYDYEEISLRIHKYSSFCRRIVAKRKKEVKDINLFWTFHTLLVHGQRDLFHLNKYLDKNRIKVSKETLELLDGIYKIIELIIRSYSKKDTANLEDIHELEKNLVYKKGYLLLSKTKGKENIVIHHLLDSIRNFYLVTSPLMGLLLAK